MPNMELNSFPPAARPEAVYTRKKISMAKDSKKQETPQVTPTMQKIMDHDEKMKKRNSGRTASEAVINVFRKHKAYSQKRAVKIDAFKDLPLSTSTISYTMANLIDQGVIMQSEDQKEYWFNEARWNELSKEVVRDYQMIFIVPLVVGVLVFILIKFVFH